MAVAGDVSGHRIRRGMIRLSAIIAVAVIIVTLVPGLGDLRERFTHASAMWIAIGCALEVLSVLAYVPAFRAVFSRRMAWSTSYKIAVAEEGAGSLFPLDGAGSLALGVWALRRGGMPAAEIARKTVAFFLLTSLFPVVILLLLGTGLAARILPGGGPFALTAVPAAVAAVAIVATIALGRFARRIEIRIRRRNPDSRLAHVAPALLATADGVENALHHLRRPDPLLLLGLFGFLAFDILAFWASFKAVGLSPAFPVIASGYLIGQLGNWIPIPGGIGGTELGLIGVLILFGVPAVPVTAAVLLYRVMELWIPALLGLTAFVQLRLLLTRETDPIHLRDARDNLEALATDPTTIRLSPSSAA